MITVMSIKGPREGRGYSLGELKSAGISPSQIKRMNIRVDARRRTTHDSNVKELTKMAAALPPVKKAPAKAKKKVQKKAVIPKTKAKKTPAKPKKPTAKAKAAAVPKAKKKEAAPKSKAKKAKPKKGAPAKKAAKTSSSKSKAKSK